MPADTFSNTLGYLIMGTGNDNNNWGTNANNSVFQIFEDAIANFLTSAVTGGTLDLSTSAPPAGPSAARYSALVFTGTLASNQTVKVPNLTKSWIIVNKTAGAFTLTIQAPTPGTTFVVPQNSGYQVATCDGSQNIIGMPFNSKQIQMPDGTVSLPSFSGVNEPASGLYRHGTQDWRFSVNGTDIFQITGGSGSPASALNVLTGNLLINGSSVSALPSGIEMPYAGIALPSGFLWEFGQAVSRASNANLLAALRQGFNGTFSSGSSQITSVSVDLRNMGLEGAALECATAGIAGLTISSVTSTTITMSGNATGNSGGSVAINAYPWGNGDGSTTFNVPDRRGRVLAGRDNMSTTPGTAAAGRLTSGGSGINGIGLASVGGTETHSISILQANLPNVNFTISGITLNDPQHTHNITYNSVTAATQQIASAGSQSVGGSGNPQAFNNTMSIASASTGITISSQGTAASGGSGTAITVNGAQPTGITNFIIKT